MLTIKCIRKCHYKGRLYLPGDRTTIEVDGAFSKQCWVYTRKAPLNLSLPKVSGPVTLLGDGPSLQYADTINTPVAAVNRAGIKYPGELSYWISLHPEYFALWRNRRKKAGRNVKGIKFIANRVPLNPETIRSPDYLRTGGGSGLYAAETLALMGFNHVHIIGIDLTDGYEMFRRSWRPDSFKIKITAHSGFLKELFKGEQNNGFKKTSTYEHIRNG